MKRINELIKSIEREGPSQGIGKPEPLKHRKAWSRRIDDVRSKTDGKQKIKKEAETLSNQGKSYLMKKDESASFARGG